MQEDGKDKKEEVTQPSDYGRPLLKIDWPKADELLLCGCTGVEVAAYFGMHPDTFYKRAEKEKGVCFSAYAAEKRSNGEALIREAQFKKAIGMSKKGDNTLLIWLGKQRLGQKESVSENVFNEETEKKYLAIMQQLNELQNREEE